jgi:hypothetical protein
MALGREHGELHEYFRPGGIILCTISISLPGPFATCAFPKLIMSEALALRQSGQCMLAGRVSEANRSQRECRRQSDRSLDLFAFLPSQVTSVIASLDFLDDLLHLLALSFPFLLAHLGLLLEQLLVWLAVASA